VTSLPGSFSAYTTFPWSIIIANLAIRSPVVQHMLFENLVSGSLRNSCRISQRGFPSSERKGMVAYNIIPLDPIRLAPGTHDPSIVESQDGYYIDSLLLDLVQVLDITGKMLD
jgi:hypothetical protein